MELLLPLNRQSATPPCSPRLGLCPCRSACACQPDTHPLRYRPSRPWSTDFPLYRLGQPFPRHRLLVQVKLRRDLGAAIHHSDNQPLARGCELTRQGIMPGRSNINPSRVKTVEHIRAYQSHRQPEDYPDQRRDQAERWQPRELPFQRTRLGPVEILTDASPTRQAFTLGDLVLELAQPASRDPLTSARTECRSPLATEAVLRCLGRGSCRCRSAIWDGQR